MERLRAAITLFTRIPAWKGREISASAYSSAVIFWPYTGWISGGITAAAILLLSYVFPMTPTVIMALIIRLLLCGALHEDGLADFCDGFGGGGDKERILRIMKDSHIGTYGVIALICYFLLTFCLLVSLPPLAAALAIFAADPFSKFCASQITGILEYARPEGSKNKISYTPMSPGGFLVNMTGGILPFIPLTFIIPKTIAGIVLPLLMLTFLVSLMKKKLGGYTGDCCGATYLLCEISLLSGIVFLIYL